MFGFAKHMPFSDLKELHTMMGTKSLKVIVQGGLQSFNVKHLNCPYFFLWVNIMKLFNLKESFGFG
jgi:hypothetical protein